MNKLLNPIARFFKFEERSATFKKEVVGGLSTFLAMAYILGVNPGMLQTGNFLHDPAGATDYTGVFFLGTALASFLGCTLMALRANVPFALAPGMGINAFFAFTVASGPLNLGVEMALMSTFVSGILYAIIAITPARLLIGKFFPKNLKLGIGAMMGLFLAYIGLVDSGIIVSDASNAGGTLTASTVSKLGDFTNPLVIIAMVTIGLVFVLHFMKVKGAAVYAMLIAIAMLAIAKGAGDINAGKAFQMNSYKSYGEFGKLSSGMWNSIGSAFKNGKFYIAVFVFLYVDFFDTTGTLFTVSEQAGFNKDPEEEKRWMKKANIVDAVATMSGSVLLTSTTTTFVESSVGVSQGARTGLSTLFTGLAFGSAIAIWPIMSPIMPIHVVNDTVEASTKTFMPVTGPVLVLVGALMISQLKNFEWSTTVDIPTMFVTMMFGMLSYSISAGIAAGVIMYFIMNTAAWFMTSYKAKRGKEFSLQDEVIDFAKTKNLKQKLLSPKDYKNRVINPVMLTLLVLAVAYFGTMPLYAY